MRSNPDRSFLSVTLAVLRTPPALMGLFMATTIALQFLMIMDQSKTIARLSAALHEDLVSGSPPVSLTTSSKTSPLP